MAGSSDLMADETFFQGIFNQPDTTLEENNFTNNDLDKTKANVKKSKKPKKQKSTTKEKSEPTNPHKENSTLKTVNKKSSKRTTNKPLQVLSLNTETQKEDEPPETKVSEQENPQKIVKEKNQPLSELIGEEEKDARSTETENPQPVAFSKGPFIWDVCSLVPNKRRLSLKPAATARVGRSGYSLGELPGAQLERTRRKESLSFVANTEKKSPKTSTKLDPRDLEEAIGELEAMFPDFDPDYLRSQCVKLKGSLPDTTDVVLIKQKKGNFPTRADYLKRQETENLQNKYIDNFSVENFLKIIPDPWDYFLNLERTTSIRYADHGLHYLKNKFKKHYTQTIQDVFLRNEYSLYLSHKELQKKNRTLKMRATNRSKLECESGKPLVFDVQFMHEVCFIENENKIKSYLKKSEAAKAKRFQQAEKAGGLLECQSCCDYNLLLEDVINCSVDHVFCKDCVVKYVDIEMENKNFSFKCLSKCERNFSMEKLQEILGPAVIATIIERLQYEELKPEGIKNLVCCPFCYQIVWMSSEITVLSCSNPDCTMESCRYCKQLNHAPQKCTEMEKLESNKIKLESPKTELEPNNTKVEENVIDPLPSCSRCKKELVQKKGRKICSGCRKLFPGGPKVSSIPEAEEDSSEETELAVKEEENVENEVPEELDSGSQKSNPTETFPEFFSTDSITF